MNNDIKEKIDELNKKISIIEKSGFNIEEEKANLKEFCNVQTYDKKFQTIQLGAKEEINELENKIISKYKRAQIFIDIDEIQPHLNSDISKEKLNKIDLVIINHLAYYLESRVNFKSDKEEELIKKLYNFIKYEYRIYYSSVVFDKLISLNFGISTLSRLIKEDIDKYINEKDVYKRFNEYFDLEQIDKIMVYLISLNEDNYKQKIIDELESSKRKYEELEQQYKTKKSTKTVSTNNDIYAQKEGLKVASRVLFCGILPRLLSLATIIGVNYLNLSNIDKIYNTTYKNYNEILGEYDTEEYTTIKDSNNAIIRVYAEPNEEKTKNVFDVKANNNYTMSQPKVTRTLYTFEVENDGRNIEDYLNIDLSALLPTSTIENAYDEDMNYLSKEELKTVTIIDKVDIDDYKYTGLFGSVGLSILETTLLLFLDLIISYFVMRHNYFDKVEDVKGWEYMSGLTGFMHLDKYHSAWRAFKNDLDSIKKSIESMGSNLNSKKLNKEELKELRKKIDTAKVEYQELLNRYSKLSELLEYNGYSMTLK